MYPDAKVPVLQLSIDYAKGPQYHYCLLYTSDAADERSSVDLGGRRIIKKKKKEKNRRERRIEKTRTKRKHKQVKKKKNRKKKNE